ncbi:MAG: TetR/AcrR family transcriptional repressor of nem operon, partial [Paraglaciecola psychrophila]
MNLSTKEELLKVAQLKVRSGGYNSFSFRELAAEVGIKSASVHYHFPTKSDLGAAVAHQYTDEFLKALGDP